MNICLCNCDWTAISAISNIIMTLIALGTLIFSIYLLFREKKLRQEDIRARLDYSIIKYQNAYYLLVENVGKEMAYDVSVGVKGKIIEESIYSQVRETFSRLENVKLIIKPEEKIYFFLCPDKLKRNARYIWRQTETIEDINQWVDKYEKDEIHVTIQYNKKYSSSHKFSIKNFNYYGSTKILNPLEQISGVISDMDLYTLDEIKQHLSSIASTLEGLNHKGKI